MGRHVFLCRSLLLSTTVLNDKVPQISCMVTAVLEYIDLLVFV